MLNALTIDVEDYFQVHAFSNVIRYEDWCNYECRIEQNVDRILKILHEVKTQHSALSTQKVQGTFFVLGWIAERYPDVVSRIQKEGHEIACHGYEHRLIYHQSKEDFRNDIRKAKAILEDIIGDEVIGYRSPSYSVTKKSRWALEILAEEGFKYDSSIFPIRHDFYGFPDAPRFPFLISVNQNNSFEFSILDDELGNAKLNTQNSTLNIQHSELNTQHSKFIIEFPISTVKLFGQNIPISGGGYFRLFPYRLVRKGLKVINEKESRPFIFYVHPWEFDPEQPRINTLSLRSKFRHYVNLDKTEDRFRKLLIDFNFSSVKDILELNNTSSTYPSKLTI